MDPLDHLSSQVCILNDDYLHGDGPVRKKRDASDSSGFAADGESTALGALLSVFTDSDEDEDGNEVARPLKRMAPTIAAEEESTDALDVLRMLSDLPDATQLDGTAMVAWAAWAADTDTAPIKPVHHHHHQEGTPPPAPEQQDEQDEGFTFGIFPKESATDPMSMGMFNKSPSHASTRRGSGGGQDDAHSSVEALQHMQQEDDVTVDSIETMIQGLAAGMVCVATCLHTCACACIYTHAAPPHTQIRQLQLQWRRLCFQTPPPWTAR